MNAHRMSWRMLEVEPPLALAGACDMLGRQYSPAAPVLVGTGTPEPVLDEAERTALGYAGAADVIRSLRGIGRHH